MMNENPSGLNTNIYKNAFNQQVADLSFVGQAKFNEDNIVLSQSSHNFRPGDVLFYNAATKKFDKAIAINAMDSEVCGIVSEVVDVDNFVLSTHGYIKLDRYSFDVGKPLYLSESVPGRLQSIEPTGIVKQIATQTDNGIIVDIQRGFKISDIKFDFTVERYTQEELDEIIKNVW